MYDLTELVAKYRGQLADPIVKCAGGSISHWFNKDTGDIKTYVDPVMNITIPYTPYGRFIHVPPENPTDNFELHEVPWWQDSKYITGYVS